MNSKIADVYDLIAKSYIPQQTVFNKIRNFNFIVDLVFIKAVYINVDMSGNNPIKLKLLKAKLRIVTTADIKIILNFVSLFL